MVLDLAADRRQVRMDQLVQMLYTPVTLDDSRTADIAVSVGAAAPDVLGTGDLTALRPRTQPRRPSTAAGPAAQGQRYGGVPHERPASARG